jgi:hypothetical protein
VFNVDKSCGLPAIVPLAFQSPASTADGDTKTIVTNNIKAVEAVKIALILSLIRFSPFTIVYNFL